MFPRSTNWARLISPKISTTSPSPQLLWVLNYSELCRPLDITVRRNFYRTPLQNLQNDFFFKTREKLLIFLEVFFCSLRYSTLQKKTKDNNMVGREQTNLLRPYQKMKVSKN